jgi:hypothetical protein
MAYTVGSRWLDLAGAGRTCLFSLSRVFWRIPAKPT